ncbi:MAG: acyl-CoA dehydrogenase family protein [Pseudomonadota bacterium]
MQLTLTEEQTLIKDQTRDLLARQADPETLRRLITDDAPWHPELWATMAELGLQGAAIPEALGGVGLGLMELCVINEEIGRAVAPVPFFSSICMAAEAIKLAGSETQQAEWLPKLASGETVATLAWAEGSGAPPSGMPATARSGAAIHGRKWPVPDASVARLCVVIHGGDAGLELSLVDLASDQVERTRLEGFDPMRHHCAVSFDGAPCEPLTGAPGHEAVDALFRRLAVIEAFEQVGGTESALYMARDYTLERYIFGRQLASYQAVKHNLADILVMLELARSNALYAADAVEAERDDAPRAAAAARIGATRAYEQAARENLQLHGGIGFTWEANCHFHYRRARLLALNIGSVDVWNDVLMADAAAAAVEAN